MYEVEQDERELLPSLELRLKDVTILRLIKPDTDVNMRNASSKTLLHLAVERRTTAVAEKLIEYGADIYLRDRDGLTPLHCAAKKNAATVSLLLNHGADMHVKSSDGSTPLICAYMSQQYDAVKVLVNHCDCEQTRREVTSHFKQSFSSMHDVVEFGNAEIFQITWSLIEFNHDEVLFIDLIRSYLLQCKFPLDDYLGCLGRILESDQAKNIFKKYTPSETKKYFKYDPTVTPCNFLRTVLAVFYDKQIPKRDTNTIVRKFLNLGVCTCMSSYNLVLQIYGIGELLESMLFAPNFSDEDVKNQKFPLSTYMLCIGTNFKLTTVKKYFKNQIQYSFRVYRQGSVKHLLLALGFFALPQGAIEELLKKYNGIMMGKRIREKLQMVPNFPSLLELGRNRVYLAIKKACRVQKPINYHAAVKTLGLAKIFEDILRFKKPIY